MGRVTKESLWKKAKAWKAVDEAKKLLKKNDYQAAKSSMENALQLAPDVDDGLELSILCQILYHGHNLLPSFEIDWYSALHLHPSVTTKEVETQFENLLKHASSLRLRIPALQTAVSLLNQAVSVFRCESNRLEFDKKRTRSGLIDFMVETPNSKGTFREKYLKWKPPIVFVDVEDDPLPLQSPKRAKIEATPGFSPVLSLCPQLRKLKSQVFDEMPQRPHYAPLEKYSSNIREGIMLGLDVAFVNLYEEIRKVESPESLWAGLDGFMKQLTELEEMGYNVEKLRERLENLKRSAERSRECRVAIEEFEGEIKENEKRIREYEEKVKELRVVIEQRVCKIDDLNYDSSVALNEFASIVKSKLT